MSEKSINEIKTPAFKTLVKRQAFQAGIKYLKLKQLGGEKGSLIEYNTLELQDYLKPCANIPLEDQQLIFSYRCEMNLLKSNFKRNLNINQEYCIKKCKKQLDNAHLTWCETMNKENDFRFLHLLNGTLEEKIGTLNQIKLKESIRVEDRKKHPVLQFNSC